VTWFNTLRALLESTIEKKNTVAASSSSCAGFPVWIIALIIEYMRPAIYCYRLPASSAYLRSSQGRRYCHIPSLPGPLLTARILCTSSVPHRSEVYLPTLRFMGRSPNHTQSEESTAYPQQNLNNDSNGCNDWLSPHWYERRPDPYARDTVGPEFTDTDHHGQMKPTWPLRQSYPTPTPQSAQHLTDVSRRVPLLISCSDYDAPQTTSKVATIHIWPSMNQPGRIVGRDFPLTFTIGGCGSPAYITMEIEGGDDRDINQCIRFDGHPPSSAASEPSSGTINGLSLSRLQQFETELRRRLIGHRPMTVSYYLLWLLEQWLKAGGDVMKPWTCTINGQLINNDITTPTSLPMSEGDIELKGNERIEMTPLGTAIRYGHELVAITMIQQIPNSTPLLNHPLVGFGIDLPLSIAAIVNPPNLASTSTSSLPTTTTTQSRAGLAPLLTPLQLALVKGQFDVAIALLDLLLSSDKLTFGNGEAVTKLLHISLSAAMNASATPSSLIFIERLCEMGANVHTPFSCGCTCDNPNHSSLTRSCIAAARAGVVVPRSIPSNGQKSGLGSMNSMPSATSSFRHNHTWPALAVFRLLLKYADRRQLQGNGEPLVAAFLDINHGRNGI
jgi:hypothetical protein